MTRFAADLLENAAAEGARQRRSARQQLDHWARVGCAVSSRHSAARRNVEAAPVGELALANSVWGHEGIIVGSPTWPAWTPCAAIAVA